MFERGQRKKSILENDKKKCLLSKYLGCIIHLAITFRRVVSHRLAGEKAFTIRFTVDRYAEAVSVFNFGIENAAVTNGRNITFNTGAR